MDTDSNSSTRPQAPSATPGILHHVPPTSAFEITSSSSPTPNLLLWIGGLTDTYHSVSYTYTLAQSLPPSWSLAQTNLSSAASGFGTCSLGKDVAELSALVTYFKTVQKKQKVVLMGHSTGCQDCLHYFCAHDGAREAVEAVVLQAPVSDREAILKDMDHAVYGTTCKTAVEWCNNGKSEFILPLDLTKAMFGNNPITARRWVALACEGGEDDYFSSDLKDERLVASFGKIDKPLLVVYGEKDEYVPEFVDRKGLVNRWIGFVGGKVDEQSKELLGGASHNLNGDPEEVVQELIKRVYNFLGTV